MLVVLVGVSATFWDDATFLRIVGAIGFILTGGAVALAIAIYDVQKAESLESERRIRASIVSAREGDVMTKEARNLGSDSTGHDSGPNDDDEVGHEPVDPADIKRMEVPDEVAKAMHVYAGRHVPLVVVASLVEGWRASATNRSRWEIGEVVRAYRRRGKGNHPWFVVLSNREEPNEDVKIWKVSRGGRSKDTTTVTEL